MDKKRWRWNVCAFLVGGLVIAGCQGNKCRTQNVYEGDPIEGGTVSYGVPPTTQTIDCAGPDQSGVSCMQTPDSCADFSFGWVGCTAVTLDITVANFQNGQAVELPSPDVTVVASLNDLIAGFTPPPGTYEENLTLGSGSVTVTISLNNFDAHFDMVLVRASGDIVVVQNGRAALLDASWKNETFCQ
jgi:hypothetical protein